MRADKLVSKEENEVIEECNVCNLHAVAGDKIYDDHIECPSCGHDIYIGAFDNNVVLGETNSYTEEQNIIKTTIGQCTNLQCCKQIALIPTEITYNANHDIYYTGDLI